MAIGTVKFFNNDRGYGFITNEAGGKDAFVHISAVERSGMTSLREGQKLSYELETGRDGKVSASNLADAS
jgi:CspA family cold shock protein